MAIRIGKYNNYLKTLKQALEARKSEKILDNSASDQDRERLALIKANINSNKAATHHRKRVDEKIDTEAFEAEYEAFIAKLKADKEQTTTVETSVNIPVDVRAEIVEDKPVKVSRKKKAKTVEKIIESISATNAI